MQQSKHANIINVKSVLQPGSAAVMNTAPCVTAAGRSTAVDQLPEPKRAGLEGNQHRQRSSM
jgi:hypothetical protein